MRSPPIAHGTKNMASWLPVNSCTRKVPLTDAIGRQTPSPPGDQAALSDRDLIRQHSHQGGEQCVEETLGDAHR